jgi:drug/metabolite transporter (DMT)-like permease
MNGNVMKWFLFIGLSFIWGSSFILMKEGLEGLNAFQVASLRIVASGLILLPLAIKNIKLIPVNKLLPVFLSGTMGSLLPAYLFCIAEQGIDSSMAGALNSLTPVFVIITGAVFFNNKASKQKVIGVFVAFSGCVLLFFSQPNAMLSGNLFLISLIILATIFYGLNVNLVFKYLKEIPSLQIVSVALCLNAIPALLCLYFFGYFSLDFTSREVLVASGFSVLLGALGTSIANILFYVLIKKAGAVFSSMVTYGIPFVAIFWGVLYHENTGWMQVLSLCVILTGVYIANRKRTSE